MSKLRLAIIIVVGLLLIGIFQLTYIFRSMVLLPAAASASEPSQLQKTLRHTPVTNRKTATASYLPLEPNKSVLTCKGFENYKQQQDSTLQSFLIDHSEVMLFNGTNKEQIIDTLIHQFDNALGLRFLNRIRLISVHHENFEQTKKLLNKQLSDDESESFNEAKFKSHWQSDFDLIHEQNIIEFASQQISLYPDIASEIWLRSLGYAAQYKDFTAFSYLITQLGNNQSHPLAQFVISQEVFRMILSTPFDNETKQMLLNKFAASSDSPTYISTLFRSDRQDSQLASQSLERLKALKFDFSRFRFITLQSVNFPQHQEIKQAWDKALATHPQPEKTQSAKQWCHDNNKSDSLHNAQKISVPHLISQSKNSAYIGFMSACSSFNDITKTMDYVQHQTWDIKTLFSLKHMKTAEFKVQAEHIKTNFPNQLSHWFNYVSHESTGKKENKFSQLSELISNGIYPKNSNIVKGFRRLSLEQSLALIKQASPLDLVNSTGATMVFNATMFGNDKLALALIKQNYPLTIDENSPDPLHAILYNQSKNRHFRAENDTLLEALVTNTHAINQWHINAMHRLKINNKKRFDEIFALYPQLYPDAPEQLFEFDCQGKHVELN